MFGIVAINGNQLSRIEEILQKFEFRNYSKLDSFDKYYEMEEYLYSNYFKKSSENKGIKGFWVDENWTYLYDPELVDPTDTKALIQTSEMLDSEIHCLISEPKSGSFVYSKYYKIRTREVFYSSNKLVDNVGTKLDKEVTVNISESLNEEKLINFSKELGLDILGTENKGQFQIGEFDLILQEPTKSKIKSYPKDKSNKWWKFW